MDSSSSSISELQHRLAVAEETIVALRQSRRNYRTLIETLEDGFCTLEVLFSPEGDPVDYRFVEVNAAFERQTGLASAAGKTARELVPDHPQHWFDAFGRIAKSGVAEHFEAPQEALGRWYEVDAAPIGEPGENLVAALFRDILPRMQANAALRASEERFRAFVAASSEVVYRMSPDWTEMRQLDGQGFLVDTSEPTQAWMQQYVAADDHAAVEAAAARAIGAKTMFELEHRMLGADGEIAWTLSRAVPILDERGDIIEWLGAASDISDKKRAEEALRWSEERLRQFGEASQDVLWIRDAETFQWEYLTPAFETIYGLDRERALSGDNMAGWTHLILPEDREGAVESILRVRDGESVTFEYRIRRPADGEIRWLRDTDFPIRDPSGRVVHIGGIGHDVTEMKQVQAALSAAEQRQRSLVEGIPQLVWRAIDDGRWTWASPQWTEYTGQAERVSHDGGWLETVHPEDRAAVLEHWSMAAQTGSYEVEYRIRHGGSGDYRWFHNRATAVRGEAGSVVEWLGTSTDVDELRALQERQGVLVAELQHRTRNLMGVIRSMADKTGRASADLPDFQESFRDRLGAMARAQGLLSRLHKHDRVSFDELIESELEALNGHSDHVRLQGPEGVRLRSSTVQTLAMALHELATNAVKYGALGQPEGRLAVTWSVTPGAEGAPPWMTIDWRESGVDMSQTRAAMTGGGQGRELIERALPYQLGARTSYVLGADGVHCTISIPVSATPLIERRAACLTTN